MVVAKECTKMKYSAIERGTGRCRKQRSVVGSNQWSNRDEARQSAAGVKVGSNNTI